MEGTARAAAAVLSGRSGRGRLAGLLPFLGPAFIASVAYIDPGNFATNIQGGAAFGYALLWVVAASNLTAMLVQALSAKLGIATGRNLAELCRERFSRPATLLTWIVMEAVAMATDLAEFVGAALGFNLLLGLPMTAAGLLTAVVTLLILALQAYGFRPLEILMTVLVGGVGLGYVIETLLERPAWTQVLSGAVVPHFPGREGVVLAVGILGATVMPHVVFLHSALLQHRIVAPDATTRRRLFHLELADIAIAMTLAGLINGAMLVMAASTFFTRGLTSVAGIEEAHRTLTPLLGSAASAVFALTLLLSGLSSSVVGTMSGQVIMDGFLRRRIPLWIRRLVTMAPSLLVIAAGWDPTRVLVISQVLLSFGLPFALVPLVRFTARRDVMGVLVNHRATTAAAAAATAAIVALNGYLVFRVLGG